MHDSFGSKVKTGIGVIFVINIAIIIAIISGVVYGCSKVRQHGLKGCVERIWNGNTNSVAK